MTTAVESRLTLTGARAGVQALRIKNFRSRDSGSLCAGGSPGGLLLPQKKRRTVLSRVLGIKALLHRNQRTAVAERRGLDTSAPREELVDTIKIVRHLQEAVISVAISDDGALCAAGTVGAKVLVFTSADNCEVASFQFQSGVNAVAFCGVRELCSIVVGTFSGFLNTHYAGGRIGGRTPPPDTRKWAGIPFGKMQYVHCLAQSKMGTRLAAGGKGGLVTFYRVELLSLRPCVLHELTRFNAVGDVYGLTMDSSAMLLATGGDQKVVQLWRLADAEPADGEERLSAVIATSFCCKAQVHSLSLTADGGFLAVGTSDSVEVFKLRTRAMPKVVTLAINSGSSRRLSRTCLSRLEVRRRLRFRIHSAHKPEEELRKPTSPTVIPPRDSRHFSMEPPPSPRPKKSAASPLFARRPKLSRPRLTKPVEVDEEVHLQIEPMHLLDSNAHQGGVAFAQDSGSILAIGGGFSVNVASLSTGGSLCTLKRSGRVRCVALSRRGDRLLVGGFDQIVSLHVVGGGAAVRQFDSGGRLASTFLQPKRLSRISREHGRDSRLGREKPGVVRRRASVPVVQQSKLSAWTAPTVVRSVHLCASGLRLAIGADSNGAGVIRVFSTELSRQEKDPLLKTWRRAHAVWVVRLSSDGALLAAAGYDCMLTLYDLAYAERQEHAPPPLLEIPFTPKRGPAFIWTLNFSADDAWLSIGCWNGEAAVYRVLRAADASSSPSTPSTLPAPPPAAAAPPAADEAVSTEASESTDAAATLRLATRVVRSDRVYAVALDAKGRHLAVGGRDKKMALYDISALTCAGAAEAEAEAAAAEPQVLWEVLSDDYIYTVAVSSPENNDEGRPQFCAFGGTSRQLVVLDGRTGSKLLTLPFSSTVWSVQISHVGGNPMLAVGGEFPTLSVINLTTRQVELELPIEGEVCSSICINTQSICYASGSSAFMYGAGGTQSSWQDRPSFATMTSLITSLASDEGTLLRSVANIISRHPSIVNSTADATRPELGPSLLHWVIENGGSAALLSQLLSAQCPFGLLRDAKGRTVLSPALEQGKSVHMQLLLEAIVSGRFLALPGPMKAVSRTFAHWAYRFPSDFLTLVGSIPLQPEIEILGGRETQDVTLTRMLIRGSPYRCPCRLWDADLEAHTAHKETEQEEIPYEDASVLTGRQGLQEGFCRTTAGGIQALRVPFEGFAGRNDGRVSPLQLILDAVHVTAEYSIFGTIALNVLLEYKWAAFGRRIYTRLCLLNLIDFLVSITFYMTATNHASSDLAELYSDFGSFLALTCIGWLWTTLMALWREVPTAWQAFKKAISLKQFDESERAIGLLTSAVALVPIVTNGLILYGRSQKGALVDVKTRTTESDSWLTTEIVHGLSAVAILLKSMRTCFSFRGFLRFGSLVHMVLTVVQDIGPFLALTSIVMLGFSLALGLVTSDIDDPNFDRHGFISAVSTSVDMGLYATTIDPVTMHRPLVLTFYFPFMLIVQVILLNLLIAIMGESTQRNILRAAMVARYERARLIVDLEPRKNVTGRLDRDIISLSGGARRVKGAFAWLKEQLLEFGTSVEDPRPMWLHVLAPSEAKTENNEKDRGHAMEKELAAMRKAIAALQAELERRCNDMPSAVERHMRLASTGESISAW